MLIQLPGSSDRQGARGEGIDAFEEGLRRDLASAPMVSYDAILGGWTKRVLDLAVALLSAPVWAPALLLAAAWAKLRLRTRVLITEERIGYAGRTFQCFSLRMAQQSATIEHLHAAPADEIKPANDLSAIADRAEPRRAKWRRVLERLPQIINVIRGDMALVGPAPLTRDQLEPLRTARRYYLSMRPGMIGVAAMAEVDEDDAAQFKIYAMSWALSTDALITWDAIRSLINRGELWRPSLKLPKTGQRAGAPEIIVRRRSAS